MSLAAVLDAVFAAWRRRTLARDTRRLAAKYSPARKAKLLQKLNS